MTTITTNEEKVELTEQTPLTQAAEPPAGAEGQTIAGETPLVVENTQVAAADKKKWWSRKAWTPTSNNSGNDTTKIVQPKKTAEILVVTHHHHHQNEKEGATEETGGEPKEKKSHWWQRKCKAVCDEGNPTFGIDYARRDEQQLQTALDLNFIDIFGEPDALHSLNGVWRVTHSIFTSVRNFFYKLFTIILCIPAAFVFGILFALVSALGVFVIVPAGRLLVVLASWIFKPWSYIASNILEPLSSGISHLFSRIRVYKYGINNDPTATMGA